MPVLFDMGAFFEYYTYCKTEKMVKIDFNKVMENFNVQNAVEQVGEANKTVNTIYVVPSVTGKKGKLKIGNKEFYEY